MVLLLNGNIEYQFYREKKFENLVKIRIENSQVCGGVQIGVKTVLTAAHCVYGSTQDQIVVSTLGSNAVTFPVVNIRYLSKQNFELSYDPAVDLVALQLRVKLPAVPIAMADCNTDLANLRLLREAAGSPSKGFVQSETLEIESAAENLLWSKKMTNPGDSGLPIIDPTGRLRALVVGLTGEGGSESSVFIDFCKTTLDGLLM